MEKQNKIAGQIYGYAVCIIAVLTFIFSFIALMNAIVDADDPLHTGGMPIGSPSLASFENFKVDVLRPVQKDNATIYVPDEPTLHNMFDAAKADKIQKVKHQARTSVIVGGLLIILSTLLFAGHWQWLKTQNLKAA